MKTFFQYVKLTGKTAALVFFIGTIFLNQGLSFAIAGTLTIWSLARDLGFKISPNTLLWAGITCTIATPPIAAVLSALGFLVHSFWEIRSLFFDGWLSVI